MAHIDVAKLSVGIRGGATDKNVTQLKSTSIWFANFTGISSDFLLHLPKTIAIAFHASIHTDIYLSL